MAKHKIRISDIEQAEQLRDVTVGKEFTVVLTGKVTGVSLPEEKNPKEGIDFAMGGHIELEDPKITIKKDSNEFAKLVEED